MQDVKEVCSLLSIQLHWYKKTRMWRLKVSLVIKIKTLWQTESADFQVQTRRTLIAGFVIYVHFIFGYTSVPVFWQTIVNASSYECLHNYKQMIMTMTDYGCVILTCFLRTVVRPQIVCILCVDSQKQNHLQKAFCSFNYNISVGMCESHITPELLYVNCCQLINQEKKKILFNNIYTLKLWIKSNKWSLSEKGY